MQIRQGHATYTAKADLARLCDPLGILREHWDVSDLDPAVCRESVTNPEYQQVILEKISDKLNALKQAQGYLTEDIVSLSPEKPNLDELLAMFKDEHHHTDDEVRAVLYGSGIFGIVPPSEVGEPFEIRVEAGDLIVVPAYTRHWFTLTEEQHIVTVRVFKTPTGWTAIYDREPSAIG